VDEVCPQEEPFYFEGVASFEAIGERFGEKDKTVGIGALVRLLVSCSDFGV
jgi:hypothetical protein